MMESNEANNFNEESKQYEESEDDEEESEEDDSEKETNITQTMNVENVDLKKCKETQLGNKSIYHGPVKVKNYLNISLPDIQATKIASVNSVSNSGQYLTVSNGGRQQPTGPTQKVEYTLVTPIVQGEQQILQFAAPARTETRNQDSGNSNLQESTNLNGPEESNSVNEETPLVGEYPDEDSLPMNFTQRLVNRSDWFALQPKQDMPPFAFPQPPFVVVCHTATNPCTDQESCRSMVRSIQASEMDDVYFDIAYNFLVGGDGYIYEGRGWDEASAGTTVVDCSALSIGFIGDFTVQVPKKKQLDAFKLILDYGVQIGKLDRKFKMFMQKQIKNTESPGPALINILIKWPNWSPFEKKDLLCNSTLEES
ncbi:uncharacterized protein isoform X2 [Rhodnius prolixus]|uniref:uncharacterized protein isoform X2 n=1 Tax=Rhodnius prolixus TaxID=13249 RepID=UPI001EAB4AC3|nr:PGRPL3b [Rhodnius prolixus]